MIRLTLYEIVKNLLNEGVSDDVVLDAIENKYHVRINYDDGMKGNVGNPRGSRVIQPMALGTTKKGYPVVRAFQVSGNSRRGAPKWKFFRLDRITSWRPMRQKKFFMPPDSIYGEYNTMGDRSMSSFVDNAKFDNMDDPLMKARAARQSTTNAPKVSAKNAQGPITANQQWKRNVYTSQPNSSRYAQYAKNVDDSGSKNDNYWDDYEKALQQVDMQNQVPKPQMPQTGPISNDYNKKPYDIDDVDFDENNFIKNRNKR